MVGPTTWVSRGTYLMHNSCTTIMYETFLHVVGLTHMGPTPYVLCYAKIFSLLKEQTSSFMEGQFFMNTI
jgi:hypothetical protein